MTEEFDPTEGRRLWRQAAHSQPAKAPSVSALDLAAWLDGDADPALAARVELALAADEGLLDTALAARAAAVADEPAPERLLVRARAMVEHKVAQPRRGGFLTHFGSWRRSLEWAAIGACFLIAASGGFWMGDSLIDDVSAAQPAAYTLLGIDEESADLFGGEI
jgi:hypothetical protein